MSAVRDGAHDVGATANVRDKVLVAEHGDGGLRVQQDPAWVQSSSLVLCEDVGVLYQRCTGVHFLAGAMVREVSGALAVEACNVFAEVPVRPDDVAVLGEGHGGGVATAMPTASLVSRVGSCLSC